MSELVGQGLRVAVPIILVGLLITIIVLIGSILLIIPGIVLFVMLWVALPAAVVERQGVFAALRRSRQLTKGARWKIFQLLFMIYLVFTVTVAVFGEPFMGATIGASNSAVPGSPLEFVVISTALSVLVALFVGVASAVSYFYLRMYKEGVEIGEIATVFD